MSGRRIGNYIISDYLGGGGFGSVFKAQDANGRTVAIKELHKKHTRSPVIKQRFFQEAIAMAKLDHPNLPKLYTFGEDNGSYYLVMEFLSGKLLTDQIHEKKQLPLKEALAIIAQVLEALRYAHQQGIIHRDLKPDNIMLTGDAADPKVKILDFGIARLLGGENLTMAGEGFGTPVYMSPERISGSLTPDSRADIYSVGIILYEMLSGRVPFQSQSSDPLIYWSEMRTLHESHPIPPMNLEGMPEEVERIIKKATAKTVEYRYATADEMLADIRKLTGTQASTVPVPRAAQLSVATSPPLASVYVDDILRGSSDEETGRFVMDRLAPGMHTVRVSKTGYDDYQIRVMLEEGKRAELQATLPARQTMMMTPTAGESTLPMEYQTARMQSGADEMKTAILMLEGVPAGSQVYIGAQAVALADEDGKATLNLTPGVHELEVKTPTGESGKRTITLTQEDAGSQKRMAVPLTQAIGSQTTGEKPLPVAAPTVYRAESSPTKKRAAAAAAVVLLTALAASSYFVFKGRGHNPQPPVTTSAVAPPETPPEKTEDKQALALTDEERAEFDKLRAENEALKKQAADKEKAKADKADKAAKAKAADKEKEPQTPAPATAPAPPAPPPQPATPQAPAETGATSCVGVRVFGPDGQPVGGARVMFLIMTGIPQKRAQKTGPKGLAATCDVAVGAKVMIIVPGALPQNVIAKQNYQLISVTTNTLPNPEQNMRPDRPNRRNNLNEDNFNPQTPFRRNMPMRKQRPPMF